ncbi:N-formylglutamate amidohydrolase [Rhodospirillum centenum]|uniref:Hydrolase, putative n=1 Tax=Rhodospirillum centenum (strain ATCC 51521 / SW) TaxID=414684 RepID=B6ITY9_RHOCS|nr:N-formylglutamate amidohydrolase [Rhodospirillum centenum]ACI99525.1 hydrolase, putative [Rhodospirillum centenum SW]
MSPRSSLPDTPPALPPLLAADEPPAVTVLAPDARSPLLLACDHASNRVPRALDGLGLPPAELARHIGWDIGAAAVTLELSRRLDATAVLTGYSRLVVDVNRAPGEPSLMPAVSDGTPVPGNAGLDPAALDAPAVARRMAALYAPYHETIAGLVAGRRAAGRDPVLFCVHSFTPVMAGVQRPWHVGVLWNRDPRLAQPLLAALRAEGDLVVGDNEPYSGRTGFNRTLDLHAEATGVPGVMIEIRQDLIAGADGAAAWAARLARLLPPILALPALSLPALAGPHRS